MQSWQSPSLARRAPHVAGYVAVLAVVFIAATLLGLWPHLGVQDWIEALAATSIVVGLGLLPALRPRQATRQQRSADRPFERQHRGRA